MTSLPVATKPLTRVTALALTAQIRKAVDRTWELLLAAYEGKAHDALGYATWDAYVKEEFAMTRGNAYRLVNQGVVTKALQEATGDAIQVSAREAGVLKPVLEEATVEIATAVKQGAKPDVAVRAAVKKRTPPKKPTVDPTKYPEAAAILAEGNDPEVEAIEADEVERRSQVIAVNAFPVLERVDVVYFIKGMEEMDPRAVARVITEREVMAHNRWWGSVVAARQEMAPLTTATKERLEREKAQ